ncbi:MAG: MATE family efflux transporter [Pirellulales bacterium]|nr:MATE family efflux transporter [Pirellulales bacterium]
MEVQLGERQYDESSWWSRPAGARDVLQIALPMVVTTLSWTLMNFIDSAILMQVSPTAMTAAYSAGIIWFAALSLLYGLCSYGSTFVAQYLGDDQPEKIGPVVWQGVWLALAFVLVIPAAQALAPRLFGLFGHEPHLAEIETHFFQILCYGAPGMLAAQSLEAFYSGRGRTWVVMLVDSGAVLINLALACVLVLGWGVPSWGVGGAASATVFAQWCRAAMYAGLVLSPSNRRRFATAAVRPDYSLIRRLVRYGGPSGVQMMLDVGGFAVFMLLVNRLGLVEAGATSLAFRVSQVAFMPVWGFGMATAVLVGQRLGEDRPDLAARAARTALGLCLAYMGTISLLFILTPGMFLQGFFLDHAGETADAATVRALTVELMRFVAAYNLFDAAVIIFVSVLRGAGDTRFVMLVSMCMASLLAGGTLAGILAFNMNVYGAWWYITVWVWGLAAVYILRYRSGRWRSMRVIEQVHHHGPALGDEGEPAWGDGQSGSAESAFCPLA